MRNSRLLKENNGNGYNSDGSERLAVTVRFHYVASTCNAEIAMRFLGVWIPILREILNLVSRYSGKKKEAILNELLKQSDAEDSNDIMNNKVYFIEIDIVEEIFGVHGLNRNV
jgi:hypothetical protein